jgi:alpha-beta hydrolase superfamily lysophospholipase
VPGLLDHVRATLSGQGVAPPYHLLAMSLGAIVAVDWCVRHPHELAGAVLINTSLRPFSPLHQRLRPHNLPALLRLLTAGAGDRERLVLRLTSRREDDDAALLDDWAAWRREHRVTRMNALRQLLAAARYGAPRVRPAVPMLVLGSAGDRLVDPRCSLELARRWDTAFAQHPRAGHDLPLDDGPWVADQVRAWLCLPSPAQATMASPNSASI